jgi:WD40 repeat protein
MEAHEGSLRALSLTADGKKLATASEKGTVIRVWDVTTSLRLHEFRRGVERASITCLAWSWDHAWLCCTSDKGTAHVFQLEVDAEKAEEQKKSSAGESLTAMLFSSVRKSVEGDARKSVCQIRGVPHPKACTFVAAAVNLVAIAGWDADGNGVLMLAEFQPGHEPNRVGYHVLCKSAYQDENDEARRRRRLRGWTPEIPQTPEGGRLYVGERLEVLEKGMEQIHFEEGNDDDEFVSVWKKEPEVDQTAAEKANGEGAKPDNHDGGGNTPKEKTLDNDTASSSSAVAAHDAEESSNHNVDLTTVNDSETHGDSLRTEPLDDEVGESCCSVGSTTS